MLCSRSSFEELEAQVPEGVHAALSGIPWWTTDVGGVWVREESAEPFAVHARADDKVVPVRLLLPYLQDARVQVS